MSRTRLPAAFEPDEFPWSREDSEELVEMYLEAYYQSLDDEFLRKAVTLSREDGVNLTVIMERLRKYHA